MDNLATYIADLTAWENCPLWPYCDECGNVTIAIGNMLPTMGSITPLPLKHQASGVLATDDEKIAAWQAVKVAYDPILNALGYSGVCDLRLDRTEATALITSRLTYEFLPQLRGLCPGFDGFPLTARRALVDMIYNLGRGHAPLTVGPTDKGAGLAMFSRMLAACNCVPPDWATAAEQCHRATCRSARNDWTRAMFLEAGNPAWTNPPTTS